MSFEVSGGKMGSLLWGGGVSRAFETEDEDPKETLTLKRKSNQQGDRGRCLGKA